MNAYDIVKKARDIQRLSTIEIINALALNLSNSMEIAVWKMIKQLLEE